MGGASSDLIMPPWGGYYYGSYDMFEPTSYKTSVDDQGSYSYYTRGDYTLYYSYLYNGLSSSLSYDD